MYKVIEVEDSVRVPPDKLDKDLEVAVSESIREKYEGILNPELGIVLNLETVEDVGEGEILPGDGAVFFPSKFKLLVYYPEEHEVTIGEVVDITEFGAFVRIGPIDAMVHVSQIMDDYVSYDKKNSILVGRDSKKILKEGDVVRARIISVSFTKENKVGLTMRQPGLGALHWLEEEEKRKSKEEKTEPKKKKK
ncbi:MAG: DNA-directed RNA polymerase [Candidatus Aenigmarchaeota archaeon]|nr:DNA-directed RNA polymerase [Candidatus Aenigmarchaeota archaeon]